MSLNQLTKAKTFSVANFDGTFEKINAFAFLYICSKK